MRTRSLVAVALVVPVVLAGQIVTRRTGRVAAGGESPAQPKELPPQNGQIADDIYAKQSRTYMSKYPMLSYVLAPGYDDRTSSWVTYGGGISLGFMYRPNLAITGDFTSSDFGGPQYMQSVQLGWRYYPSLDYERKISPFLDARGGFSGAYETYAQRVPGSIASSPQFQQHARYVSGFGVIGGAGFDYPLWDNFTLQTEMLASQSRMTTMSSGTTRPYNMAQYTFAVGVSYSMVARRAMTYRMKQSRALVNRTAK